MGRLSLARKNCIVCGNKINREKSFLKLKRGNKDITCCPDCSRIYQRIYQYISCGINYNKMKKDKSKEMI